MKKIFIQFLTVILFLNLLFTYSIFSKSKVHIVKKYPIVYSKNYDISILGIEKLHPFDTAKYSKIYKTLSKKYNLKYDSLYHPQMISDKTLLEVHSKRYLDSLNTSKTIAKIAEIPGLALLPSSILKKSILKPMKYATDGTIKASKLALKHGWAINLSGGYHHAKRNSGSGFCFYGDINLAAKKLLEDKSNGINKILVIDLDAHQGNGIESLSAGNSKIDIFDVYNASIYPADLKAARFIEYKHTLDSYTSDTEYLKLLSESIPNAIEKSKPDFIFYNAGSDIYEKDPLGHLSISKKGIIKRDEIVFRSCLSKKIPVTMVLSGGYHKDSYKIVSESIINLIENVVKIKY